MATIEAVTTPRARIPSTLHVGPPLHTPKGLLPQLAFFGVLLGGLAFAGFSILGDTHRVGEVVAASILLFLAVALIIALGFEFVNGFHDTANAVATVIYTHALPAPVAVVWSGLFNFLGVMLSSGGVAYAIVALLPVELVLNVGSGAGYAMIFALLLAAVVWNLATWSVGLPNSSSHTLIGSILGVGLANQFITAGGTGGTSGVDVGQVQKILTALLVSPLIGFVGAMTLVFVLRNVTRSKALFSAPEGLTPPPRSIRALLIATCTAVSFTHGSNDGQKGMGLIMLILIGCAPTAYALKRTATPTETAAFVTAADRAAKAFAAKANDAQMPLPEARAAIKRALKSKKTARGMDAALATTASEIAASVRRAGSLAAVPAAATQGLRDDMYLVLEGSALAKGGKGPAHYDAGQAKTVDGFDKALETETRFIPYWVKIAVALALGLGTMIGWKRIVITVGEKIGKSEFTYATGASAELVTAITIYVADALHVPVSTTHILTSGVAGAAVGQGQGLNFGTIRNMALAWVVTLPVTMALAGALYWLFLTVFVGR